MKITITHARYAPSWSALEKVIQETTNDEDGRLSRVARRDNGCNYRAPGVYDLDFRQSNKTVLPIELDVVGK